MAALYQTLDPLRREIRLLEIHGGMFHEKLRCTLRTVSLEEIPVYEALSYNWGDGRTRTFITLQGLGMNVTVNLKLALQHLRRPNRPRVVWADAVCINQEDNVEKSSQVAIMGDIYRKASNVIAWLGEASYISDLGIDTFKGLGVSNSKHWDPEGHDSVDPKYLTHEAILGMIDIMERSWWRRIWTVQESILGSKFSFLCGTEELPCEYLFTAAVNYFRHTPYCCYGHWGKKPENILLKMNEYMDIANIIRKCRGQTENLDLQGLIAGNRMRQCANARDKVYGLLGLDKEEYNGEIVPDYSKSIAKVFEETAINLLHRPPGGYSLFSLILPRKDEESNKSLATSLPSWVPDWTAVGSIDDFLHMDNRMACLDIYCAGGRPLRAPGYPGNGRLECSAVIMATISELSVPCSPEIPLEENVYLNWRRFLRVDEDPDRSYPFVKTTEIAPHIERMPISEAYRLTLCSSAVKLHDPAQRRRIGYTAPKYHSSVRAVLPDSTVVDTLDDYRLLHDIWLHMVNGTEPQLKHNITLSEVAGYNQSISSSTNLRRLFLTGGNVGLMGLAPIHARHGDVVAVIDGAYVPVILRKAKGLGSFLDKTRGRGTRWHLVGDAYVQGVMDGEGLSLGDMKPIVLI